MAVALEQASYPADAAEPRVLAIVNPAAAAELTFPVPGAVVWEPRGIVFTLTTDANVADRYVAVLYRDPTGSPFVVNAAAVTVAASSTQRFAGSAHRGVAEWNTDTDVLFPLEPARLSSGDDVHVDVAAIQAGDQLSGVRLFVYQWPVL